MQLPGMAPERGDPPPLGTASSYTPTPEEKAEFDKRLAQAALQEAIVPARKYKGKDVIWAPQDGSQDRFMGSSFFEALYHGTRGPGKTDALLMSFAQHVGRGHGAAWRGIIFRQTYPQLADVQAKSEKWFRQIFGSRAKFNRSKMQWEWATGEVLMLRHMARPSDYWNYHGQIPRKYKNLPVNSVTYYLISPFRFRKTSYT